MTNNYRMIYSAPMSTVAEAPRFSRNTAADLQNAGFVIVTSEGISIQGHKEQDRKFWSKLHAEDGVFESLTCEPAVFAYHPDQFILPGSKGKSLEELEEMIQKRERQLKKGLHLPGRYKVEKFTMQEVVALLFDSMENGKPLVSEDVYTWTSTHYKGPVFDHGEWVEKDQIVVVGLPMPTWGPSVGLWLPDQKSSRIGIAAKVVPL